MIDLEKLSLMNVREVWSDESRDFTPWLAENADRLGEALGMKLLHEQTEAAVGRYSADLVFRDESSDRLVVVENMFDATDHDHLGKLVTYAAGLEAGYAVLLSPEFREEHRSALNWLNSISSEDFGFFGVVLEVCRIGDSLPAPCLRVEVKPDGWRRSVRAARASSEMSERQRAYWRFWDEFLPEFRTRYPDWTRASPSKNYWMLFRSSRSRVLEYSAAFCRPDGRFRLRAAAYIDTGDTETTKKAFEELHSQKERVVATVGECLDWDPLDHRQASRISLYFGDEIRVTEEERWPEAREWLIDALGRMRDAFDPVLKELYP